MAESPEEKEALAKLDAETREVGWEEFDKEHPVNGAPFWMRLVTTLRRFGRY